MKLSKNISDSLELKFSKLAKIMNQKNQIYYSLGLGEPNYVTPKFIVEEAYYSMKKGLTKYSSPIGDYSLRKKIADKLRIDNKIKANPEEILISAGSKMSLYLTLLTLIQPKDHVIYISPCYTSYLPQILLSESNIKISSFDLNKDFKIDYEKLRKTIKKNTKVILINFPHNPTGQILKKNDLLQLEKIFKKNKKCFLISDEIYKDNIFSQNKHLSPASLKSIARRVVTISGFSKAFSMTGWRIGYSHANKKITSKMVKIQQHILTNVPLFIQKAALKALSKKSDHLKRFNNLINKNHTYAYKVLSKNPYFHFKKSYGGFFIFLKINKRKMTSDIFCTNLLKKYNVAVTPGKYFGKNFNNYIRISLSQKYSVFKNAIDLINKFTVSK